MMQVTDIGSKILVVKRGSIRTVVDVVRVVDVVVDWKESLDMLL